MAPYKIPFILAMIICTTTRAQLFPLGTKFHIADLGSYVETNYQRYSSTITDTITLEGKLYTWIKYPDFNQTDLYLRIDSNKLYVYSWGGRVYQIFDFNAKLGDSINVTLLYGAEYGRVNLSETKAKIDSIFYTLYRNENNIIDSLKTFKYSGSARIIKQVAPYDYDTVVRNFHETIIEKIMTIYTTYSHYFLTANMGSVALSDEHQRIRCIEFPDGKMMKMKWWYDMVGNNFPCDYKFTLGENEIQKNLPISIYPNPAFNQLSIENYSGKISIVNMLGQETLSSNIKQNYPVDISMLSEGVYFVKFPDKTIPSIRFAVIR